MPNDSVSVDAQGVEITYSGGKFRIGINDIKVDGLTLPKFTWGWIGYNLAQTVLNKVGGILFDAIEQALGLGGPSLANLMQQQLQAIAQIISTALRDNELRNCAALLDSLQTTMREYLNDPDGEFRLDRAILDSTTLLSQLKTLGYPASDF